MYEVKLPGQRDDANVDFICYANLSLSCCYPVCPLTTLMLMHPQCSVDVLFYNIIITFE